MRKILYYKKIQIIIKSLIKTIVFDIQYEIHKQTQQKNSVSVMRNHIQISEVSHGGSTMWTIPGLFNFPHVKH